jgi:hypothetical protein
MNHTPSSTDIDPTPESSNGRMTNHRPMTLPSHASSLDNTLNETHAIPTGYRVVRLSGLPHR